MRIIQKDNKPPQQTRMRISSLSPFSVAFVLLCSVSVAVNFVVGQNDVSLSSNDTACDRGDDGDAKVVCEGDDFEYTNACLAEDAGFDVDSQCCNLLPEDGIGVPCAEVASPVTCGAAAQCEFVNLCSGQAAGYTDCCRVVPDGTNCTLEEAQVICSECPFAYDNLCQAEAAGYTPDECCPRAPEGTLCTADNAPLVCGPNSCLYANICNAEAAGFTVRSECCNAVPEGTECPGDDDSPVVCDGGRCELSNSCEARAAGYTNCCPVATGECTLSFEPVTCGDNKCPYDNLSCAEDAGFLAEECCPVPDSDVACTTNSDPVECGSQKCAYANECVAEAAGFDADDCEHTNPDGTAAPFSRATTIGDAAGAGRKMVYVGAVVVSVFTIVA